MDVFEQSSILLPDRVRLPFEFDPALLAADLAALEAQAWVPHVARTNYRGGWAALPLRCAAGAVHPIRMVYPDPAAKQFEDTKWLALTPYFRAVLAAFECPLRTARLMRLTPGSAILRHEDPDLDAAAGTARLHVPIATNDRVEFLLNGVAVTMAPGNAWYLRLTDPHEAANRGTTDRVHLVIDAEVDSWLMNLLVAAAARGPGEPVSAAGSVSAPRPADCPRSASWLR
jgi:hypothetical protein